VTSAAIWKLAIGIILLIAAFALAIGAKRTVAIGTVLVLIPFQTLETRIASSSVLIAYVLATALLLNGTFKFRMLPAIGLIVLAYFLSLSQADRSIYTHHVLYMFQFFSCFAAFLLAYNFAILVDDERSIISVLLAINVLAIIYCILQLSVGPGERFVPFGIEELRFNLNRHADDPRLVGPFDNPGCTAGYFALMTLVCAFEVLFSAGRRRLLIWGILGFNVLGLVATGNRAGFIVLLAMSPLILLAYRKELGIARVMRYFVGGTIVLVVVAAFAVNFTDFNRLFMRMDRVTETEGGIPTTRAGGWPVAIEKIKKDPWFGEGPYFWTAEDAETRDQLQTEFEEGGAISTAFDPYPHSLYLYLLRTVGVFGLLAVVGFFVSAWFVLLGALRRQESGGYRSAVVRLGLFLIPAFLISQATLEFNRPTTIDYAQFIFALVGLFIGVSDRSAPSSEAAKMPVAASSPA
jgi:hypothetical protein